MRQARILSSAFLLFLLWWLLAVWMDNDFIIPYPLDVLKLMGAQLQSAAFYQSTLVTLLRSWGGLLAAFVMAGGVHSYPTAFLPFMICFIQSCC